MPRRADSELLMRRWSRGTPALPAMPAFKLQQLIGDAFHQGVGTGLRGVRHSSRPCYDLACPPQITDGAAAVVLQSQHAHRKVLPPLQSIAQPSPLRVSTAWASSATSWQAPMLELGHACTHYSPRRAHALVMRFICLLSGHMACHLETRRRGAREHDNHDAMHVRYFFPR